MILVALAAGLFLALAASLWVFPGEVFRWGASFAGRAGISIQLPNVSGNPAGGWLFEKPSVEAAGYTVTMRRLFVDVDWSELLRGRPTLDALWIDGLNADIHPVPSTVPVKPSPGGAVSLPVVHDLRLTDARFSLRRTDAEAIDVRRIGLEGETFLTGFSVSRLSASAYGNDIHGRGRYDLATKAGFADVALPECLHYPGLEALERYCLSRTSARVSIDGNRLALERFSTDVAASTVTASGKFTLAPFSGQLHIGSAGPFVLNADAHGDTRGWEMAGVARRDAHSLAFSAGVKLGDVPSCVFDVRAAGIPADLVPGLPPPMGLLSGHVSGAVHGKRPSDMDGDATLSLASTNGPHLNGGVKLTKGLADATIAVSSGGLSGKLMARWDLGRSQGDAKADLRVDGKGLRPWTGVGADGTVRASVTGRAPDVSWKVDADLKNVDAVGTKIDKALLSGSGPRLSPVSGRAVVEVSGLVHGTQRVDAAKATIEGTPARHHLDLSLSSEGRIVDGSAAGSLAAGRWSSTWDKFSVKLGDTWTVRQPFELAASAGGVTVRGLRLASGDARLDVDGGVRDGQFQDLRIHGDGIALAPFGTALKAPVKVSGALSMNAAVAGPLSSPEGRMTATVDKFAVNGTDAGVLTANARVAGGRVYLDEFRLDGSAGKLDAEGSFPISFAGKNSPPVRLHIKADGLDPAALPLPEGIHFEKARVDGDLSVNAAHGDFSAEGRLTFSALKLTLDDEGVQLTSIEIRLAADGKDLKILKAVARTGKGTLALDGTVTPRDAAVTLRARGFEINHPIGIFVRTDADLALSGAWDAPRVIGTVDIQKADIQPGKARKPSRKESEKAAMPPERAPSAGASPFSADVRIVFNNNVWYKDGQSAIEFKGNLNARKSAGDGAQLFGTIETIRGEYIFYGRGFKFDTGTLSFNGSSPPDPTMDISATYVTDQNNVKIILTVKGTLSRPELTLASEPPMEETDIVSVLVTGAPRGQGNGSSSSEAAARLMAANYLAEKLRSRLQNKVPVDQLKFKLTEQGAAEVTVGQNVTDKLYVSYARTLGAEGERRMNADYTLSPRWSLNGQTSSIGRYVIDLLFKYGFH